MRGFFIMTVPAWLCFPFVGLLLSVALFPLIKPEWWEKHEPLAVAFWSVLVVILFAVYFGPSHTVETVLECFFNDYLTFIILLLGLY